MPETSCLSGSKGLSSQTKCESLLNFLCLQFETNFGSYQIWTSSHMRIASKNVLQVTRFWKTNSFSIQCAAVMPQTCCLSSSKGLSSQTKCESLLNFLCLQFETNFGSYQIWTSSHMRIASKNVLQVTRFWKTNSFSIQCAAVMPQTCCLSSSKGLSSQTKCESLLNFVCLQFETVCVTEKCQSGGWQNQCLPSL